MRESLSIGVINRSYQLELAIGVSNWTCESLVLHYIEGATAQDCMPFIEWRTSAIEWADVWRSYERLLYSCCVECTIALGCFHTCFQAKSTFSFDGFLLFSMPPPP